MKANKLFSVLFAAFVSVSCSDIYDNIKDFSPEEKVYPARFDIVTTSYGFERVEFDFGTQGRVPASQMYLGKAKKTFVEYDAGDGVNVGKAEFDSVCSWVEIKGLTQSRIYEFKIYTEDQYGNRSIANEISVTPFTREDLSALAVTPPTILESTNTVSIEWKRPIESDLYSFVGYSYAYTNSDNQPKSGSDVGNLPAFFVENIERATDVPVKFTARVVPNYLDAPLKDTVDVPVPMTIRIADNAQPVVFLKLPVAAITVDPEEGQFPVQFNWIPVDEATGYVLKFSLDPTFPADATVAIPVGTGDTYEFTRADAHTVVNGLTTVSGNFQVYWAVGATGNITPVNEQVRGMRAISGVKNLGRQWTFDNSGALFASVDGSSTLVPVETGGSIISIAGPSASNGAIRIPAGSYLQCNHGLTPTGAGPRINKYSVIFDVRIPNISDRYSFMDTHDGVGIPTGDPDFFLDGNAISSGGYNDTDLGVQDGPWPALTKMTPNVWSRVMYTVDLDLGQVKYYVNGIQLAVGEKFFATTNLQYIDRGGNTRYNYKGWSLDPAGVLLFAQSSGTIDVANVQFLSDIPNAYEMYRLGGVGSRQIVNPSDRPSAWAFGDNYKMNLLQNAIDNNVGTTGGAIWPPADMVNPETYWFIIDLKKTETLTSYSMQGRWSWWGGYDPQYSGIGPYYLEISDDNTNWREIGRNTTASNIGGELTEIYFDPDDLPSGRYLKVVRPAGPSGIEDELTFIVGEIYIFGPK